MNGVRRWVGSRQPRIESFCVVAGLFNRWLTIPSLTSRFRHPAAWRARSPRLDRNGLLWLLVMAPDHNASTHHHFPGTDIIPLRRRSGGIFRPQKPRKATIWRCFIAVGRAPSRGDRKGCATPTLVVGRRGGAGLKSHTANELNGPDERSAKPILKSKSSIRRAGRP